MTVPLHLLDVGTFSDEALVRFCVANPSLRIERDEDGLITIDMSPTYILTSANNSELNGEFIVWNRKTKAGKVIDSNGGFFLADRSMRAPDVAWIRRERWDALDRSEKKSIPHIAPDFVLELVSDTDSVKKTQAKMKKWLANGVRLGWMVVPREAKTYVYRPGQSVADEVPFTDTLSGEDVLPGFATVLAEILEL